MQKNFFIFSCEAFFLVWLLHVGRGLVQQPYDRKTRHTSPDDDCDDGDDDGGDDDCDDGDGDTLYNASKVHHNMIARSGTTINVFSFLRARRPFICKLVLLRHGGLRCHCRCGTGPPFIGQPMKVA